MVQKHLIKIISNWNVSNVTNMIDIIKNTKLELVLQEYNIIEKK